MSRKKNSTQVKVEPIVSFLEFFQESLTKGLVKPWQEKEIRAFFKDLGLTEKETADAYKIALAKY